VKRLTRISIYRAYVYIILGKHTCEPASRMRCSSSCAREGGNKDEEWDVKDDVRLRIMR